MLEADAALLEAVPQDSQETALSTLLAESCRLERGDWDPSGVAPEDALGLLVLDGLLIRKLMLAGTASSEILGGGDLLRPWDDETALNPIPAEVSWIVVAPTRFAILDSRWTLVAGRWPQLGAELLRRVMLRSRWLAVLNAVTNTRGLENRVLLLLWHVAGLWGRVTPNGTLVPFRLTHEVMAELIGARRPSVSTAVAQMEREGTLERHERGWLIHADPPAPAS